MRAMIRWATLLVLGLLSGCATELVCPARGGPQWYELTSPHYLLRSDLPPDSARAELVKFEALYDILARFAFAAKTAPVSDPIQVVLFRNGSEYHAISKRWSAGRFNHDSADPEDTPVIAMFGDFDNQVSHTLPHELSHFFIARYLPSAPLWLNEGLATYYETTRYSAGRVVFGHARPDHLRLLAELGMPPLQELLFGSAATFYKEPTIHYAGAWLLTHLLSQGPGHQRAQFYSFLNALASGQSLPAAWRAVYGALDVKQLEEECRSYLVSTWDALEADFRPTDAAILAARVLTDSEVHLTWERLRGDSPSERDKAAADLREALLREPGSAEANYRRAMRLPREQAPEAERLLRAALQSAADEPRYWHALLRLQLQRQTMLPESSDLEAAVQHSLSRLIKLGRSARSLDTIARYYLSQQQLDESREFAEQSIARDPRCWACRDTLARILFNQGFPAEALAEQQGAINLLAEGYTVPQMYTRLEEYKAAAWAVCRKARPGAAVSSACRILAESSAVRFH